MHFAVRPLVLSLLTLLPAAWFLITRESIGQYVDGSGWTHQPQRIQLPEPLDARLDPQNHALRDAKRIDLEWIIRQELRSPDGVLKSIYTVNGLFPGPTIQARSGDRIVLRVHNDLDTETTAIHFHGIRHIGSNSMDGTPGLTQCAIQPKKSFLYDFAITNQSGTYWWHSHSLSQRADGLFGAFVVHEAISQNQSSPVDIGHSKEDLRVRSRPREGKNAEVIASENQFMSERILLIGDWYHANASAMLKWYSSKKSNGWEPTPETALFNGVNAFDCSRASRFVHCDTSQGQSPSLSLDLHAKTRLRLVNTGYNHLTQPIVSLYLTDRIDRVFRSLADLEITLSSHTLVVIEADGSPVVPHQVNSVTLAPGQRYSVILELPSQPREGDSFWLRLRMSEECFNIPNDALDLDQFLLVFYGPAPNGRRLDQQEAFKLHSGLPEFDPLSLVPLQQSILPQPDKQLMIYVNSMKLDRLGGIPYGYFNLTSWVPYEDEPLLLKSADDNHMDSWGENQLVVTTHSKAASVIDLIINNLDEGPHPLHLHGHHFYPLHVHKSSYGWGKYNYSSPPPIPNEAPVLRDTFVVPRRGHVVIRFLADAPGMWLFHCHVLVHLSTGMAMTFNVRPALVSPHERQLVQDACHAMVH